MKLLVGSVYIDHIRSKSWYDLQLKYLNKTTLGFKHVVCTSGKSNLYNESTVIKIENKPMQAGHILGLNTLIKYFNNHLDFDYLLLLDSDCFPIQNQWNYNLVSAMGDFDVAAIARCENLDIFAHPCMFFVNRSASKYLKFDMIEHINLAGFSYKDTMSNITRFFPLIRSNLVNYHPVLFGVYWNCFYHHGAGSRNPLFRLRYYYNETKNKDYSLLENAKFEELVNDSDKFLGELINAGFSKRIKLC